jgi:hypothetical protein
MSQNARGDGISHLYHYEGFNSAYLEDCLVEQRIHCSDPANLNDPWDCRPWFNENALEDPKVREDFMEWLFSFTPSAPVPEDQLELYKESLRNDPVARKELLGKFSRGFMAMIPGRWRIYCLTPVAHSTLMWSHYADNHRGICLEFSTDHSLFGSAQKVEYLSSYPGWNPKALMDRTSPHMLLSKSSDWSYEKEYRIVGLGEGVPSPLAGHALELKGQFLALPTGALKAVIVGCELDVDPVKEVVAKAASSVKVKKVIRSRTEYKLEIIEVA